MEFAALAKERFSCRAFTEQPVEQEKINKILEAGIAAPTAVNRQPYKIWVMKSEQAQKTIQDVTRFSFGAKLFFVVGANAEPAWVRKYDDRNFADVDASIVATHMMMEIQDLGLGTTWVGHFDAPKLKELYPEMAAYDLLTIFPVGYPAQTSEASAHHGKRNSVEEMVSVL